MSLFQARDWWGLQCGNDEQFDQYSLCIANIDNNPEGTDKLIVGSHSGILRVFAPNSGTADGMIRPYQPNDLLLEADLQLPILHVAAGFLLSATDKLNLAVLHPRKLCVYSIAATNSATFAEHGSAYNMLLIYEHKLQRGAFNMVVGPFGHVKGRDFLCVQCLDGTLSFYEQESFAFSRFLPNFLLPGPVIYSPQNDSFIVNSSNWTLESYRYQSLAIAKDEDEDNKFKQTGRKATPDWSLVIGEAVIDMSVVSLERNASCIIALGERNLFAVKTSGKLWFMKKFDFSPICMYVYLTDNIDLMILVVTELHTLLVYNNDVLKWATKLPFSPVAIRRANVRNIRGSIICLSENGYLSSCYLGTNPSLHIIPANSEINIANYAETEEELQQLKKIINAFHTDSNALPSNVLGTKSFNSLSSEVIIAISEFYPLVDSTTKLGRKTSDMKSLLTINIRLQASVPVTNLRLMVHITCPLYVEPKVVTYPAISMNGNVVESQFFIGFSDYFLPQDLKLTALVTYVTSEGFPRVAQKSVNLPLYLVARYCSPVKEAEYSLSFDVICQSNTELKQVFSDLSDFFDTTNTLTDGFSLNVSFYDQNSASVSVIVTSRAMQHKFKFKSDSMASLAFVARELMRRLAAHNIRYDTASLNKNSFPVDAYLRTVENHLNVRYKLMEEEQTLSNITSQFRALQKRLLVKLKDRNPSPLTNLDLMIEATHNK
ncbi:protein PTHB1-like isoform X1, partial [Dinothrombium tinctorium]